MTKELFTALFLSCSAIFSAAAGHPEPLQSRIETRSAKKKLIPFVEEYRCAEITPAEKARGFMLFTRPLSAPVYPESVPREHEKISQLHAFGARGQYVNLNFCIYPLKNISSLLVKDSGGIGQRELRHLAYWLVNFPGYHAGSSGCRRMPTFLFRHDLPLKNIPANEPHRFLLTVKLPDDAKAGVVKGALTLDVSGVSTQLPYSIKVLPFKLKRDPRKKFSAYNYDVYYNNANNNFGYKLSPDILYRAQVDQFRRMKEYGFDFLPVLRTERNPVEGKYLNISNGEKILKAAKEAGLSTSLMPLAYCHVDYFYNKHTGARMAGRGRVRAGFPFPDAAVKDLDIMLKKLRRDVDSGKIPEPVFAAVDEPVESARDLCMKVFKVIHDNGFKTMLTEPPFEKDIDKYVTYWNHLYFRPLDRVMKDTGERYWCYPNFNSCECTDPSTMARGGRMVYGYGMWKSNYNVLIPWIFAWNNYRLKKNSGGNFVTPDGRTEMTIYWECFREGIIDGEYVYTLQEAVVRREGTRDPELKALLAEAKELLQKMWLQIPWALYYQREGFLTDSKFDGYRTAVADVLSRIMRSEELNKKQAPPILVDNIPEIAGSTDSDPNRYLWSGHMHTSETDLAAIHEKGVRNGMLQVRKIPADSWKSNEFGTVSSPQKDVTRFECSIPDSGKKDRRVITFKTDFGTGGPVNFMDYDYLRFRLKVSSNRTGKTVTWFPLTMVLPFREDGRGRGIIRRQHPDEGYVVKAYPVYELRNGFAFNSGDMKNIPWLGMYLHTSRFAAGDRITFDFKDFELVRFTTPVIHSLQTPEAVRHSDASLAFKAVVFGIQKQQNLKLRIRLTGSDGRLLYAGTQDLTRTDVESGIPLEKVKFSGGSKSARLHIAVCSASGKVLDEKSSDVRISNI